MKNLSLLRIFVAFPLIAIVFSDVAFSFDGAGYIIPVWHFVAAGLLLTTIFGSYLFKNEKLITRDHVDHTNGY